MICVIGAANIDIQGFSKNKIIFNDSNPGILKKGFGGVARNICENLSMLNTQTSFIAPIGDDIFSKDLIKYMGNKKIDMSKCLICNNMELSTYLAILNEEHEMILAISSMDILNHLNISYLEKIKDHILKSEVLVLDTNLNTDVLEYLSKIHNKIVLDLVSTSKAVKIKDFLGNFHTIKANKIEAEQLSNIKINNDDDLIKVGRYFINQGVKNIFITLGSKGIFYMNNESFNQIENPKISVVDITGAGDAFSAGLAYSLKNNFDINKMAKISLCMSLINVSNYGTCYQKLNKSLLNEFLKNFFEEEI